MATQTTSNRRRTPDRQLVIRRTKGHFRGPSEYSVEEICARAGVPYAGPNMPLVAVLDAAVRRAGAVGRLTTLDRGSK